MLAGILPRVTATVEAGMIFIFTLLTWIPGLATSPGSQQQWAATPMSWIIGAAALVVADSHRGDAWISDPGFAPPQPARAASKP